MVSLLLSLSSLALVAPLQLLELPQLLVHLGLDVARRMETLACREAGKKGGGSGEEAMGLRDCPLARHA